MRYAVLIIVASVLFYFGTSDAVYEVTSPSAYSYHVLLRKLYSIVAFTLVGWLFVRAVRPGPRRTAATIAVALYSAVLEVAQWLHGSHEGFGWNAFDTLCGALGGYLGAVVWSLGDAGSRGSRASSRR